VLQYLLVCFYVYGTRTQNLSHLGNIGPKDGISIDITVLPVITDFTFQKKSTSKQLLCFFYDDLSLEIFLARIVGEIMIPEL
jgi:hypothetical protein